MFGAQIPRRHSSFHNKHVNPRMLCLIMASCISPQAPGTVSELARILFILNVLSASGQAGASQAAEPFQQLQRTGAVWQRVTHRAGNRITAPLPVTMATTQQAGFGQKCQFKQLLISSACPCIAPSLDKGHAIAGHSIYQIRKQVPIQLENNLSPFFWLILFQTARLVIQFLMQTHKHPVSVQWRWWQKCRDKAGECWWLEQRYHWPQQCLNSFGSPGSFSPCPVPSPFPLLPFCKCFCSCTREAICLKDEPVKNGYCQG